MDILSENLWIGFLGAALYLKLTKQGNLLVVLGLLGLGVGTMRHLLWDWAVIPADPEFFDLLVLASVLLLIVGIVLMAKSHAARSGSAGSPLLDASGMNLSTLFIPRNHTNTYSAAEALRDAACARLVNLAKASGIEVIEQKSNPHSPSVWFRLDYLLADSEPELSLRAYVEATIERYDFHRFPHLFTIVAQVGTEMSRLKGVIDIDEAAAKRIHAYIMQPGTKLRIPNRVRSFQWQVWRPRNKAIRLRPDWLTIGAVALALLLVFVPVIGPFLLIGIFIALSFRNKHRRTYVLTSGKPHTDPRSLRWMDSWQATVAGLASSAPKVSQNIMARIQNGAPQDLSVSVERIGYWSVDSRVIRDQVAIRYRRALGFVHVVPYGENLYVGWECHLNVATWKEETLARGVDRVTGRNVHANRVVSGVHSLNEYDVADSNFLAEWLHESVKQEVKLQMAEHQIDQEIDFTVQRESRKEALAAEAARPSEKKKASANLFKRVA